MKSNFTGKTTVFRDERNGYTFYAATLSSKQKDGTYHNLHVDLQCGKDVEFKNKEQIEVKESFLGFTNWKNGDKKGTNFKLVVMEFERLDEQSEPDPTDSFRAIENECPF